MNTKTFARISTSFIALLSTLAWAAEDGDSNKEAIRTSLNQNPSAVIFNRKIFHTIITPTPKTRLVPYTVSVPYEAEETYYESERQCGYHDVNRCESVPGPEVCENHETCRSVSEGQICEDHPVCNSHGCTSHTVCRSGGSHQECSSHPVCHSGPSRSECHTESEYSCQDVSVPHTRLVTRYRDETHYRSEEYIDNVETRIPDREYSIQAMAIFPEDSALSGDEKETLSFTYSGNEEKPNAELVVNSTLMNYEVVKKEWAENQTVPTLVFTLRTKPKYSPEDLGVSTISKLIFERILENLFAIDFYDTGLLGRTETTYTLELFTLKGESVYKSVKKADVQGPAIEIEFDRSFVFQEDYRLKLTVERSGPSLSAPVKFQKNLFIASQVNPLVYGSADSITDFKTQGVNSEAELLFKDLTVQDEFIETVYSFEIFGRKRFLGVPTRKIRLGSITVKRTDLNQYKDSVVGLKLSKLEGITERDMKKFLDSKDTLYVNTSVKRSGARVYYGQKSMNFEKTVNIKLK